MLLLFANLYLAMFTGTWNDLTWNSYFTQLTPMLNALGTFLTSIFGDNNYDTLGTDLIRSSMITSFPMVVSMVLSLITSIGIVVAAGKVLKRIFGVFFTLGR